MKKLFYSFLFILLISSNSYAELDTNIQNREYNKFTTDSSGNTAIRIILPDGGGGGGSGTVNSGVNKYYGRYPSTGTTIDDSAVTMDDGTNVGIGVSTPIAKLSVLGTAYVTGNVGIGGTNLDFPLQVTDTSITLNANSGHQSAFFNYAPSSAIVDTTGKNYGPLTINVGPQSGVSGSGQPGLIGAMIGLDPNSSDTADATYYGQMIMLQDTDGLAGKVGTAYNGNFDYNIVSLNDFRLATIGGGGPNPEFFMSATDGNIGLGTSTPSQNLEIAGNLKISNTVNNTTTPLINAVLTSSTLEDGSTFTGTDSTMSTTYIGTKFTASASATLKDLSFRIKASGSMTGDYGVMQAFIYADDGGSPSKPTGSALANFAQVAYNSISTSYAIIGMGNASTSYALVSGTTYWLVIKQVNAPSTNNVVFDSIAGSNYGVTSSDGSTWTNTNNRLRFLIYGASYIGTYSSSQTKYGVYGTSSTYYGGYFHSDNYDGLYADSTNGVGASFHSNTSHGIKSTSENSNGIYGISNGSAGVRGDSTTSYGLLAIPTHAVTNSVINTLGLRAQSSGTTTAGFGNGIEFQSENGSNSNKIVMQLAAVYQDVTSGSEDADFDVRLMTGGSSAASKFMVKSTGRVGIGTTAPTEALHVVGNITTTGQIVSTKTTDIGWSVVAAANQACNTTCTNACVMGFASAATGSDPVLCTDSSADNCLCAGSN